MEIDLTKPFKLVIEGELLSETGEKYVSGIYPPGEGLPDKLRLAHYGHNVEPEISEEPRAVPDKIEPRDPDEFKTIAPPAQLPEATIELELSPPLESPDLFAPPQVEAYLTIDPIAPSL